MHRTSATGQKYRNTLCATWSSFEFRPSQQRRPPNAPWMENTMTGRPAQLIPAWPPDYLDMRGVAHLLSTSPRQVQRMLASGSLPPATVNISGTQGLKGRRWSREKVLGWLGAREC